MSLFAPTTLADLMGETGMTDADERLRWMALTWDVAAPVTRTGKYCRFYASLDCFHSSYGNRSQAVFSTSATDKHPLRGRRGRRAYRRDAALEAALEATKAQLAAGYSTVCRPLAVDLRSMAGAPLTIGFSSAMGVVSASSAGTRT